MIRAYHTAIYIQSPFLPPIYEVHYTDFKSIREFKKKKKEFIDTGYYFGLEKYDKKGNFIKEIKK